MDCATGMIFILDIFKFLAAFASVIFILYSIHYNAKVNLFNKRYDIYDAALKYISYITSYGHSPDPTRLKNAKEKFISMSSETYFYFHEAMRKSKFLFGDEIHEMLNDIYEKSINVDYIIDHALPEKAKAKSELLISLTSSAARDKIDAAFSRYLKFHD